MDKRVDRFATDRRHDLAEHDALGRSSGALLKRACNWRKIDDGVALSGQGLHTLMLKLLKSERVRSVVNLRGANAHKKWYCAEVANCAQLGIGHHDVRLSSKLLPERATLLALLDAFDRLERPILIKCAGGVDRSMFAAGLYRLRHDSPAIVQRVSGELERPRLRHLYRPEQRWVRAFPDYFAQMRGRHDLRGWIEHAYTVAGFEAYLQSRGMAGSWRARRSAPRALGPAR